MKLPLSAIIIAGKEEKNIRACLESVAWIDEIVVVYSSKEDRTADIAREFTKKTIFREFDTFTRQREFLLSQSTSEWALSIDADERVPPALRTEIELRLPVAADIAGFYIPRRGYFLGKWLRQGGWYPDYQLRLFRRSNARLSGRMVHEGFLVNGKLEYLTQPIDHFCNPTIYHHLKKNLEYTRLESLERSKSVRPRDLLIHPIAAFLKMYIGKKGWRDGAHGLAAALIHAAYNLQQYLYMWEMTILKKKESEQD